MPSPFPGMDPFIEMQEWSDFHARFMTVISEVLTPDIRPRYIVRVERRVYVEQSFGDPEQAIPDIAILERTNFADKTIPAPTTDSTSTIAPVECLLPEIEETREYFLTIKDRETQRIVTMIELLSPSNKRAKSVGNDKYISKRTEILQSDANLIELDFLRFGQRLPMQTPLPPGDYYALVCRAWHRRRANVYAWTMRQQLPTIPIPLCQNEPEPHLDLQKAFELTFERAAYQDSLDYSQPLKPAMDQDDSTWMEATLRKRGSPT
jgi:hypothetical protein